jgi:hypothetical protein
VAAMPWLALLSSVACNADDSASASAAGVGAPTDAAPPYEAEVGEPTLTLDDLSQAITRFFEYGVPIPYDVGLVFYHLMGEGDEQCPGGEQNNLEYVICTASTDYYYNGIGWFYEIESDDRGRPVSWTHGGDFEIIRPDGTSFGGGGGMSFSSEDLGDDVWALTADVHGSWIDETRDDWLGLGFSAVLTVTGTGDGETGDLLLDGGLGIGDDDAAFSSFGWDLDGDCGEMPIGELDFRDPEGGWYMWALGDDCDACGPVVYSPDTEMGEMCLDLSGYKAEAFHAWMLQ